MPSRIHTLLIFAILNSVAALSAQKLEAPNYRQPEAEPWCIFGYCFTDSKSYKKSMKVHDSSKDVIEDLQRKSDELEQWKKENEERLQLEAEERRQKAQDA